mgnify:FL=1
MNLDKDCVRRKASKRPFMRLFTSDYRDGTAQLSFELQGFYFRILTYLHDGERVPADPAALATFLQCSPRTVRAYLPKLIAVGKLYEIDGEVRNKRIDRDLEPTSSRDGAEVEPSSARTQAEVEPNSGRTFQKPESNQYPPKHTMEDSTATSTAISREDSQTASVEQAAEGLAGLNGMVVSMVSDVQRWMVGGDERSARTWLSTTTRTFGSEVTKAAYQKLGTDMAEGAPVARPLQTWTAIAQRMKAGHTKPAAGVSAARAVLEARKAREVHP